MDVPDVYTVVFQNLKLLCLIHPDSQDIKKLLKQDMFKVPDFKAFQYVMNFLLNLLIPQEWKQLIVWPVFDRKTEFQFRLAVKKALSEVNKVYSSENLPVARGGTLTNAGGKDFAVFVFQLTTFILRKSLVDKYGVSDLLFIPLNSENYHLEKEKVVAFRELAVNAIQDFIDISTGVEGDAKQREIIMDLKDVKENVTIEEQHLFKLVQSLSQPEAVKRQLLCPESSVAVEKLSAEIESRIRKATQTKTYLEHIGNGVSHCRKMIEYSVECSVSGTCIDLSSAKSIIETQSQISLHEELPRVSDIILEVNNMLHERTNRVHKNGVPELTTVLYSLKDLTTVFEDLERNVTKTHSELEKQLEELKHSYSVAQNSEELNVAGCSLTEESLTTPELNFYKRLSGVNNREAFFGTPKSGADKKVTEKTVCKPNFDSDLILSPSLKSTQSSPADVNIKCESSHTQLNVDFRVPPVASRYVAQSESKFKPQATNLSLITDSLLKSTSKNFGRGKALSTICNKKTFRQMQRNHNGQHLGAVSKALFGKDSNNSMLGNSPTAFSSSEHSEESIWDSAGDLKENALDFYSSLSLQSEITSPSAILSSTKVEESERTQTKKKKPRKSLEALIARYKKVISGSTDVIVKKET